MSGKKKKLLHTQVDSLSAKLSGLVEEARFKEPDAKIKVIEERTLTKSLTTLREEELHNERIFDRSMEEVKALKTEREKNNQEEIRNLRIKKEIQLQLLGASKTELEILKREMNKLKEAKINLLKEMESYNINMNNDENETPTKDVEDLADNTELKTERQTVEEMEKTLSELKKKSVQLVSAAKIEKDSLIRKIAYLREITVKRANCKRQMKEFEKKEMEKKETEKESSEMKENREKKGKKVVAAEPEREIQQFEFSEMEEDQLRCLDEEITKTELEHRAVLLEIDEVLGRSRTYGENEEDERREKISELRTRLQQMLDEDGDDLTNE